MLSVNFNFTVIINVKGNAYGYVNAIVQNMLDIYLYVSFHIHSNSKQFFSIYYILFFCFYLFIIIFFICYKYKTVKVRRQDKILIEASTEENVIIKYIRKRKAANK